MEKNDRTRRVSLQRKTAVFTASVLAAVSILLTACSKPELPRFLQGKPTAVTLAKAAADNIQKAESVRIAADIDAQVAMTLDSLGMSVNADLEMDMEMEMTKSPMLAKGSADVQAGVIGQNQSMHCDFYVDGADGDAGTTYMRWNGGEWTKKRGEQAAAESGAGSFPESFMQSAELLKLVAEEAMAAELKEETVTVNEKEAWQINTTLSGALLKEILSDSGSGDDMVDKIDWDTVDIPAEIYIYSESELPARIVMDCTDIGAELLKEPLESVGEDFPLGPVSMKVSSCKVDLTFDRYNEIEAITIPQEARDAEEVESLAPGTTDMLEGLF